ncbi:anti-sigma factor family protein [Thermodesulfobacteriota bacterium]
MKKSTPPQSWEHPENMLFPYLENLLDPGVRFQVEEHVGTCPHCSSKLAGLRETIERLKANREAFCPEPWQLYELRVYGDDPNATIAEHLRECPSCREIYELFSPKVHREEMPDAVRLKLKKQVRGMEESAPLRTPPRSGLLDGLLRIGRIPAFTAGAVAAAILALVFFYPTDIQLSIVALSSVEWKGIPKPKGGPTTGKQAAIILVPEGFSPQWSQKRIDSMYQAVGPTMDMYERFHIITPGRVKESVDKKEKAFSSIREIPSWFGKELGVDAVAVIKIVPATQGVDLENTLFDTHSGAVSAHNSMRGIPVDELGTALRKGVLDLFLPTGAEEGSRSQ